MADYIRLHIIYFTAVTPHQLETPYHIALHAEERHEIDVILLLCCVAKYSVLFAFWRSSTFNREAN